MKFPAFKTPTGALVSALLFSGLLTLPAMAAAPANDSFANPATLVSNASGTNVGATVEAGEPAHANSSAQSSVWWTWTPAASGPVEIDTTGSDFDTRLAVYSGAALSSLTLAAENDDINAATIQSRVWFVATAGTAYRIAVDGFGGQTGHITLAVRAAAAAPANDAFADRTLIGNATTYTATLDNSGASAETGEPPHAGQEPAASLWWTWTAPSSGLVQIDTVGSSVDTLLAVYTGTMLDALTVKAFNDDVEPGLRQSQVSFEAVAGASYVIAVDSYEGSHGQVTLNLNLGAAPDRPANDDFAGATNLGNGATATAGISSAFGTAETGEPLHVSVNAIRSVWWRWTAPAAGSVVVKTAAVNFDTLLAIYTGTAVNALTTVAANDDAPEGGPQSLATFTASAGVTYFIAVDGYDGQGGTGTLDLALTPVVPANDAFAARINLGSSANATAVGTNLGAAAETNEPAHAGAPAARSVWWQWTAPATGDVEINTEGSSFDTRLAVFTGTSLAALSLVAENDNAEVNVTSSKVRFAATAGAVYGVVVDGANGAAGVIALNIKPAPPPPPPGNDLFANRTDIGSGDALTFTGTNARATAETGEPAHAGRAAAASVWWKWTAATSGLVTLSTAGSQIDTTLAVYSGSAVNALVLVRANDDAASNSGFSMVRFHATAGTSYAIAVDGADSAGGALNLSLQRTDEPPGGSNDFFSARTQIPGNSSVVVTGSSLGSTAEAGEPPHAGADAADSVWWTWTAPASGWMTFSTEGSDFDTRLAVYTGGSLNALALVASNDDALNMVQSRVQFAVVSGTVYQIAVDGYAGAEGNITLTLSSRPAPPDNDAFADRGELGIAIHEVVEGTTLNATTEAGEPAHGGIPALGSVWWEWLAPTSGSFSLKRPDTVSTARMAVYTGSALETLTPVASGSLEQNGVVFNAIAGTLYKIAADVPATGAPAPFQFVITETTAAPPVNDAFAAALEINVTTLGTVTGTSVGATAEAGEPAHAGLQARASVWWKWTATTSGHATVDTLDSSFDTRLAIYQGTSLVALSEIAANDDMNAGDFPVLSAASFSVTAGSTYYLCVDGFDGQTGAIHLHIGVGNGPQPPANDSFAQAANLGATEHATFSGSSANATAEAGEPAHAGNLATSSVWFKWTAPHSISVTVDTLGTSFDSVLGVYTGTSVSGLTLVGANDDVDGATVQSAVRFAATVGSTYYFVVDGFGGGQGALQVNLDTSAPDNDNFADRTSLGSSVEVSLAASSLGATEEQDEPQHAGTPALATVWWTWTAPANLEIEVDTLGSTFDTVLAVYTGSVVGALTPVASNSDVAGDVTSRVGFHAVAGTVYHIAVGSAEGAEGGGSIVLHLNETVDETDPVNDDFSAATDLGMAANRSVTGSNVGGTFELHEPAHASQTAHSTVWWKWTAPASGKLTADTLTSSIDTVMALYHGASVGALTLIASNDDAGAGIAQSKVEANVIAGVVYHIAVDGFGGAEGAVILHLNLQAGLSAQAHYDAWKAVSFRSGTSAAARALDQDPDRDGIANGMEFLMGADPESPGPQALIIGHEAGASVLAYPRRRDAPEGIEIIEVSSDLRTWSTLLPQQFTKTLIDSGAEFPHTALVTIPSGEARQFFRLRISIAP